MKTIRLYESFAGIGSQAKALDKIAKTKNINVEKIGVCEFYIDAIIGYISIHYGNLEQEKQMSKEQMVQILNQHLFSSNSKSIVSKDYFNRINENKLRQIFPYLYAFVNQQYLHSKNLHGGGDIPIFKYN
ncbi:DNA (cytosine-5-)-methyltransferase N-terminal subunit [Mycoplasmopsis hyopharyngis]|uniref:DNA (cytosine-5-)-methyltransferase N-terminal subunit n=1 Tax=Mycoplasmopsis hyopharyngis TaxID=29558 RepID=UPI0038737CF2